MKKQSTAKPSTKSKPKTRLPSPLAFPVLENPKEHFVGNFRILPPETGKRLMLDGENCEITSRKWEAEDSPEIVTHNGVELPVTTIKRYIIDFTIRKPDGTAIRLVVHPPFLPLQARMNPLEVESITPVMKAGGLGGRDEIPHNALVHFAEQSTPRRCYTERLPVEGEAPAPAALRDGEQFGVYTVTEAGKRVAVASKGGKPRVYIVTGPKLWDALAVLLPAVEGNQFIDMKAKNHDGFYRLFKDNKKIYGLDHGALQFKKDCLECRPDAHGGNSARGSWWRLRAKPEI